MVRVAKRAHAGGLMARAIAEAGGDGWPVTEALRRAARERGRELADAAVRASGNQPADVDLLAAARGVLDF